MTLSTSLLSYTDCTDIYDRAMASPYGVRVRVKDYDTAFNLRSRMHYARKLVRQNNAKSYDDGHPLHGTTPYDTLTIRIRHEGEQYYLYLEPNRVDIEAIELIEEEDITVHEPPQARPVDLNFNVIAVTPIRRRI